MCVGCWRRQAVGGGGEEGRRGRWTMEGGWGIVVGTNVQLNGEWRS